MLYCRGRPGGHDAGLSPARAGVDTPVLEKHADFLRDFRGDTIYPSTLELMYELGLLDDFLKRPHQELQQLKGKIGDSEVTVADFSHLPTHCRFIAFMPQWDFLNFLVEHAAPYPAFHLKMQADVTGLLEENGRVMGVRAQTPNGDLSVRADLVVGADGRHSTVRRLAGLQVKDIGAPMDILWMRISRQTEDPEQTLGVFNRGKILVMLLRDAYWQCGLVIPKGGFEEIRCRGLDILREEMAGIAPFLRCRVEELRSWGDIKLLTVAVDRLRQWHKSGLLCIGDAAHAMSPVGGVGINLAIQDAVAAANLLTRPLQTGTVTDGNLHKVQRRRECPTRLTQGLQVFIQNRVIRRALGGSQKTQLSWVLKCVQRASFLSRIPARLIGLGFRPEHVKTGP